MMYFQVNDEEQLIITYLVNHIREGGVDNNSLK